MICKRTTPVGDIGAVTWCRSRRPSDAQGFLRSLSAAWLPLYIASLPPHCPPAFLPQCRLSYRLPASSLPHCLLVASSHSCLAALLSGYPASLPTCLGKLCYTCLAARLYVCFAAWLLGCLAAWLPGCLAAWLPGCLAVSLAGCLVGKLSS